MYWYLYKQIANEWIKVQESRDRSTLIFDSMLDHAKWVSENGYETSFHLGFNWCIEHPRTS